MFDDTPENTVLRYPKKEFTKKQVLKERKQLTEKWWVLKSTKTEHQLRMHPRLIEGTKAGTKRPLTPAEQKKFGVYKRREALF